MHCLWVLWLPRKQSIRTYAHDSRSFQTRNRIGEQYYLQPGYFHPRDVAADAPESAWFATSSDERRSNARQPPNDSSKQHWPSARFTDRMHTWKWRVCVCFVRKPVVFFSKIFWALTGLYVFKNRGCDWRSDQRTRRWRPRCSKTFLCSCPKPVS